VRPGRLHAALLVVALVGVTLARASFGDDAPRELTTVIDGKAVSAVRSIERDGVTMLDLGAVARDLGDDVAATAGSTAITDNGVELYVSVGKLDVLRWDGSRSATLEVAPIAISDGTLYIALGDVAHVFSAHASIEDGLLTLVPLPRARAGGDAAAAPASSSAVAVAPREPGDASSEAFVVHERPIVRATPSALAAAIEAATHAEDQPRRVGTIGAIFDRTGGTTRTTLLANGDSAAMRGTAQLVRSDSATAAYGEILIGSRDRYVGLGQRPDPLAGPVFATTATSGFSLVDRRAGLALQDVVNQFGTHTYALQRTRGNATTSLLDVATATHGGQLLLSERSRTPLGEVEFLAGTKGVGIGLSQETTGRLFLRASESYASPGLPLTDGSAPIRAMLGWKASGNLTLLAGYGSAYNGRPSSVFGFSGHAGAAAGTLMFTPGSVTGTMSVNQPQLAAFLTASHPRGTAQTFYNLSASAGRSATSARLRIEASATTQSAQRDVAATLVPAVGRAGIVAGLEMVRDSFVHRFGPVLGFSSPVTQGLRVELASHPTANGAGLRVGISSDIVVRPRTFGTDVQLIGASGPVDVYVDARSPMRVDGSSASIRLSRGTHSVWARAADGQLASELVTLPGATRRVALQMLPLAAIVGHVTYEGPTETAPASLAGFVVKLSPCGQVTTTDRDGAFSFAPQAIPPGSQVAIEGASLPGGIAAADGPVTVAAGAQPVLRVRSSRRVETTRF
jgi:hypothetical protein